MDSAGSIYVTGYSASATGGDDYATVKYDANGNELWVRRYDGGYNDRPAAMKMDTWGNVFVTGRSENAGTWNNYATVKYDANGNEQWIRTYDAGYGYEDVAKSLEVDAAGNVFVTGASDDMYRTANIVTIKYAGNGNEQWIKRYDSSGNSATPVAMTTDSSGNVYITSIIQPPSMPTDVATIKYDTNGNEKWTKTYDGGSADTSSDIVVDTVGNIYITGSTIAGSGTSDYMTIKYNQKGQ